MKRILIPVFPGTNCERETKEWIADNLTVEADFLDLKKHTADSVAAVVVPGGFSYGDYLRAGALAARSAEMKFVSALAANGVPVMGICNGFQILCEAKLLPGVLTFNETKRHHHFPVNLSLCIPEKPGAWTLTSDVSGKFPAFALPISCGMGKYLPPHLESDAYAKFLKRNVFLKYQDNENGSTDSIAGIVNDEGNVLGMMPHPERASDAALGSTCGLMFLHALSQNNNIEIRPRSQLARFAEKLST